MDGVEMETARLPFMFKVNAHQGLAHTNREERKQNTTIVFVRDRIDSKQKATLDCV